MASMAMTQMQSRSAIFLLLAVTVVGVHAGRVIPNDFTFTNQPRIPINRESLGKPFPEITTRFESQRTNLDQSQFWASTQNSQDSGRFTQPRGEVAKEYNYAMEETIKPSEEFFTPEMLARIKAYNDAQQEKFVQEMQNYETPEELARVKAFNEAQQANFDRRMQNYEAKPKSTTPTTSGSNEYPKILPDGTELLWVTGPVKTSPEEIARLEALMGKPKSTAALPGAQRNEVQGSTDVPVFNVDTSNWEDGPWGTKHRPGAEHSVDYVGFEQPDGTKVPQSVNNP